MSPVLTVRGLEKVLRSSTHRFDLRVPEVSLEQGRFYGLVGKSGSGKSTMLDILAMVSMPTAVEIFEVKDSRGPVNIARLLQRGDDQGISRVRLEFFGYVLQSGGLFEFLTVRQNLNLPRRLAGAAAAPGETEALARTFDMNEHIDKFPSELSGGQRQRVSILRALSLAPAIVLADEPTASVDETMADVIVGELKSLAQSRGSTVLMVSHDLDLIGSHADEVLSLRAEAVAEGHTVSRLQPRDHG